LITPATLGSVAWTGISGVTEDTSSQDFPSIDAADWNWLFHGRGRQYRDTARIHLS
jgi:hypothetical protein